MASSVEEAENDKDLVVGDQFVGNMTVDRFFAVAIQVFQDLQLRQTAKGNKKLVDMTTEEFMANMVEALKTRAMRTAVSEAEVTQRILMDWEGLKGVDAVTQPFRLTSPESAQKFVDDLKHSLSQQSSGTELVVAVAVCSSPGMYKPLR